MSAEHHYSGDPDAVQRFVDQGTGTAKPAFPDGKVSEDDEGELAFAVATDLTAKIIRIDFNKPVHWLGLDVESAAKLKDLLAVKVAELRIALAE